MGTKNNPGKYDCHKKAEGDEPIFTLRANDPLAPILVGMWIGMRQDLDLIRDSDKETEAAECAEAMIAWLAEREGAVPEQLANEAAATYVERLYRDMQELIGAPSGDSGVG